MDPSSAVATCNRNKRKDANATAHGRAKRLKTVQEGGEPLECGRLSGSPRISVLPDRLQQPVTLNDLTELLHYAALGKTGGIGQPR